MDSSHAPSPRTHRHIRILLLVLLASLVPATAFGYALKTTVANVDWNPKLDYEGSEDVTPLRWFEGPVYYTVSGKPVPGLTQAEFSALVQDAAQIWVSTLGASDTVSEEESRIPGLIYDEFSNSSGVYGTFRDEENTVYFIHDPAEWAERGYDPKALAMTNIFVEERGDVKGRIVETDIEINGSAFDFENPAESIEKEKDRLGYTIQHEFGHVIGLGHSEFSTSVMFATTTDDELSFPFELDNDDVEGACFLYQEIEVPVVKEAAAASSGGCSSSTRGGPHALPIFALIAAFGAALAPAQARGLRDPLRPRTNNASNFRLCSFLGVLLCTVPRSLSAEPTESSIDAQLEIIEKSDDSSKQKRQRKRSRPVKSLKHFLLWWQE